MKKILIGLVAFVAVVVIAGNVNARVTLLHPERSSDQFRPGTFIEVAGSGFTCRAGGGGFIPYLSFDGVEGVFDDFVMLLEEISRTDTSVKLRLPGYDSGYFNNDDNPLGPLSILDEETRGAIEGRRFRIVADMSIILQCGSSPIRSWLGRITVAPPPTSPEIYELSPLDVVAGNYFRIYGSGFTGDSTVVYVGRDEVVHEIEGYFENTTLISAHFPETTPHAVYTIYVRNPSGGRVRSLTGPDYVESNGIGINVLPKVMTAPLQREMRTRPSSTPEHVIAPTTGTVLSPATSGSDKDKDKGKPGSENTLVSPGSGDKKKK